MIYGIGTDIIELERVKRACRRESFLTRSFTENERREALSCEKRLAGDFAVKEAVAKALGTGIRGFELWEIECLRDSLGAPYVRLSGGARALCRKLGITHIHVSIADSQEYVTAVAVAERRPPEEADCSSQAWDKERVLWEEETE